MFAGVRLQFGPIDSHMPELDQARLVAQPQSLGEQLRQTLQMRLPKAGDRIVIGVLVRRQVPERYVFMGRSFDLPRTNHSPAVTVQQHPHHHRRVVGRHSSSILTSVDRHDLGQVQFVGYLGDEARQMILRQPVLQRRREKEYLVQVAGAEALSHTTSVPDSGTFAHGNVPVCPRPNRQAESISDRLLVAGGAAGQNPPAASRLQPNLAGNIERPLRYTPDRQEFVIENGGEFFNRPLYGGNTAFRADAGDQPEFSLYLPGHGGNLRFGIKTTAGAKWLHETARITARYRPGTMLYEVRDPLLGPNAVLRIHAIALHQTDGLAVLIQTDGIAAPLELVAAYGGLSGKRGARDGDIGTEAVPIGEYFQLKPESCQDNSFTLGAGSSGAFTLRAKAATIAGLMPPGAALATADARQWNSVEALLASVNRTAPPPLPGIVARIAISPAASAPLYFALQRISDSAGPAVAEELATYRDVTADGPAVDRRTAAILLAATYGAADLPRIFAEAEEHLRALRGQIVVETPDPFINAAAAALNVATDAVWDAPQGAIMHGAIAWRSRLLGWRGPYAPDALGWHDRARRHFTYWATRQNTSPIPEKLPPPDEASNLARNEAALHSNGDMSNSHYDMNTVFIDALFRHLRWTGDLEFARRMWPVIERHLAWERRLFRREYGPEKLPLYEAYAVIWASDDLGYNGGGATHSSAYNYDHNLQAARLARLLGQNPAPYEKEAALIARAMREFLWMPDRGMFAEYRDYLGLQRLPPSAALWSFYHTMDAGLVSAAEANRMAGYVDSSIPHFPVRGPGVPTDDTYRVLATRDWMPYRDRKSVV